MTTGISRMTRRLPVSGGAPADGARARAGWTRAAAATSIASIAALACAAPAGAQTLVNPADLRAHFEQLNAAAGPPVASGPAWQFNGGLDLSEAFTDNAYYSNGVTGNGVYGGTGKPQSDLITIFTPSVSIMGDSARVKVNLSYAPTISIYAKNGSLDQISQNLNGTLHGIIVPDTLFLDLNAFAAAQSLSGGTGPNSLVAQDREAQTQNYTFSASPYLQHRFGSTGLGEVGYSVSSGSNNNVIGVNDQALTPQQLLLQQQLNQTSTSSVVTQTEHATFTSGEDFGRVSMKATATTSQYSGGGIYQGAHNSLASLDFGYAINRLVAALAEIGYENIVYNGLPPVRISDGVWAVGAKLTPNADSSLTATIGHRYGARNILVSANYAATARLRVFASYSESLTTSLEDIENTLGQIDVDTSGAVYDRQTGAPISVVDNFFGIQNNVYRLDRTSVNGVMVYTRDVFSLALSREIRTPVSSLPGSGIAESSHGIFGTLSWGHDLSPVVSTNVYLQYGTNHSAGITGGSQNSIVASVSLTYVITPTLSANALYSYSKSSTYFTGQSGAQNYVLVGLHKRF